MRKLLFASALGLAFIASPACAQTITKGVQLSQDPTGPIGMDAANNVYFPKKILSTNVASPVLSTCGTTPTIVGNDTVGKLTTGGTATTCTVTFTAAYNVAPACIVQPQGGTVYPTFTTSTTAITITVDVAATVYNYICLSQG